MIFWYEDQLMASSSWPSRSQSVSSSVHSFISVRIGVRNMATISLQNSGLGLRHHFKERKRTECAQSPFSLQNIFMDPALDGSLNLIGSISPCVAFCAGFISPVKLSPNFAVKLITSTVKAEIFCEG